MDEAVKRKRQQFMEGNEGGTFSEVLQLTSIIQLSHVLYSTLLMLFPSVACSPGLPYVVFRHFLDFGLTFAPFILSVTVLSDSISEVFTIIVVLVVINFVAIFLLKYDNTGGPRISQLKLHYDSKDKRLPFVSNLMSSLLLATMVAILAVDFRAFPRRLGKTELYGWSLMDVGVGGFIAINAALSAEARHALEGFGSALRMWKSFKSALPLIVLGFVRLALVKATNYQEHESEYGRHWNFFFTIAFAKLFASLLCTFISALFPPGCDNLFTFSFVIIAAHQWSLVMGGLARFIQNDQRDGLVAANKEGIISIVGFIALYLFFVQYGRRFLPKRTHAKEVVFFILQVLCVGVAGTLAMFHSSSTIEPVSRREANAGYFLFMISFISLQIIIELIYFLLYQIIFGTKAFDRAENTSFETFQKRYQSQIFEVVARNGLIMFLYANVLTGAINFSLDTQKLSNTKAVSILFAYAAVLVIFGFGYNRSVHGNTLESKKKS